MGAFDGFDDSHRSVGSRSALRRLTLCALVAVSAVCLGTGTARAETPSAAATPAAAPSSTGCSCPCATEKATALAEQADPYQRTKGYVLPLVLTDLANATVHLVASGFDDKKGFDGALPYTLAGVYVFSGPLVHLANGRLSNAGQSLGLRVALPVALGLLGLVIVPDEADWSGNHSKGLLVGGLIGMTAGVALDAAVLGRGEYVGASTATRLHVVSPWVEPRGRGAGARMQWVF